MLRGRLTKIPQRSRRDSSRVGDARKRLNEFARDAQRALPKFKDSLLAEWDKAMHRWETRESASKRAPDAANEFEQDPRAAEHSSAASK